MLKKVLLMILDGWGITRDPAVSAIARAHTPYIDSLYKKHPHAQLLTHGENVGLPEGQMGNSEVGHMNLGAGRIVWQDLTKINRAVRDGSLARRPVLAETFDYVKKTGKNLHFIGLVSDGGVHSHINHLKGLLHAAQQAGASAFVHAFTDGRDTDPHSGAGHLANLEETLSRTGAKLASVIGRYYAMDRDNRWERTKQAYDLLVHGKGESFENVRDALAESYEKGVSDEFVKPVVIIENGQPVATIREGDAVVFFNFRTDRGRQLTQALTQRDFPEQGMKKMPLHFVTMTNYDDTFSGIRVIYDKENIPNTLGEVLAADGKTQIRIAETEKYPHVTFFFSGGRETPFEGEKRILCPSPKVATYDLQPEMSAYEVRDQIVPEIQNRSADFICLNFANPDMVGHTGVFEAAVEACEAVDTCVQAVVDAAVENGYASIILADHGNCETMANPDGTSHTSHTTNPVPVIVVDKDVKSVKNGILADIAPTVLSLMGIVPPEEMTGKSLVSSQKRTE